MKISKLLLIVFIGFLGIGTLSACSQQKKTGQKEKVTLTEEEKKEREEVRKIYLENFKKSVRGHLESIKIVRVDDDGNPINDDGEIIEPEA